MNLYLMVPVPEKGEFDSVNHPAYQGLYVVRIDRIPVPGPVRPPHPEFAMNIGRKIHPADLPKVCCTGSLNLPAPVPGILDPADPDNAVPAMIIDDEMDRQIPVIPELHDPAAQGRSLAHCFKDRYARYVPGFHMRTPMMISGPYRISGSA